MTKAIELSQLGSNLDVGTEIELSLPLRTNNAAYGNNIDVAYLIVGTPGYTGATTNWNTFGLQHRFKSNPSGTPRVTVDSKNGELFCVKHDGKVGVGTDDPMSELDVHSSTFSDITVSSARTTGNIGGFNFRKDTGGTPTSVAQMFVTVEGHYNFRAGGTNSTDHAFRINANGNVGVGTDNPATKFAVHGVTSIGNDTPSTGAGNFNVKPHDGQDNYLKIRPASDFVSSVTGSAIDLRNAANSSSTELIVRADRYRLWTSNEKITVTNSGLVGINETNPGHYIDMNIGTTNIGMKMTSTDAGSYIQFADNSTTGETRVGAIGNNFKIDVNNGERILVKGDGNVGIGTDNPGAKLHIQGTSRQVAGSFSDNITYGGRTFTANYDIQATSMRGGILVRNMNNFRSETDAASFMHYDGYTTSNKSYAFRAARGATLSDTFWVKSDGSVYAGNKLGVASTNPLYALDVRGESMSGLEFKAISSENGVIARESAGFGQGSDNSAGCGVECILFSNNIHNTWVAFDLMIHASSCATTGGSHSSAWFFYRCRAYANSGFSFTQVDSGGDTGSINIAINDDGNVGTALGLTSNHARQFEVRMSRSGGQRSTLSVFVNAYPKIARFRRQP